MSTITQEKFIHEAVLAGINNAANLIVEANEQRLETLRLYQEYGGTASDILQEQLEMTDIQIDNDE
jgi:hypothetical protein